MGVSRPDLADLHAAGDVGHRPVAAPGVGELQGLAAADRAEDGLAHRELDRHRHVDDHLGQVIVGDFAEAGDVDHRLAGHGPAPAHAARDVAVDKGATGEVADAQRQVTARTDGHAYIAPGFGDDDNPGGGVAHLHRRRRLGGGGGHQARQGAERAAQSLELGRPLELSRRHGPLRKDWAGS